MIEPFICHDRHVLHTVVIVVVQPHLHPVHITVGYRRAHTQKIPFLQKAGNHSRRKGIGCIRYNMMNNDLLNRFMATPLEREHGNNCVEMRIERHGIVDQLVSENSSDWRLAYANDGFPTLLKVFHIEYCLNDNMVVHTIGEVIHENRLAPRVTIRGLIERLPGSASEQRGVVSITGMYDLEEGILISLCNGNRMSWQ